MKGHNYGNISCRKCGKVHKHPKGALGKRWTLDEKARKNISKGKKGLPRPDMIEIMSKLRKGKKPWNFWEDEPNVNKKQKIRWRDQEKYPLGSKCLLCGDTQNLERHHPSYDELPITVCKSCHLKLHYSKFLEAKNH